MPVLSFVEHFQLHAVHREAVGRENAKFWKLVDDELVLPFFELLGPKSCLIGRLDAHCPRLFIFFVVVVPTVEIPFSDAGQTIAALALDLISPHECFSKLRRSAFQPVII